MPLQMRPDVPPFLRDENGHIPMNDETADLLVIVTREALEGVASPPDASEERLMEYADIFGRVATYKLEHGRAGGEDTIWVQMEDVVEWRSANYVSSIGRSATGLPDDANMACLRLFECRIVRLVLQ